MQPEQIRSFWKLLRTQDLSRAALGATKNLLNFLCSLSIGAWDTRWADLLARLPLPKADKYAAVRAGDVFLSIEEEAAIVRALDGFAAQARRRELPYSWTQRAAILICSFQFGMRAKQIALLRLRDIRVWEDGVENTPTVHLTFRMLKQRWSQRALPMVRKVKREWCPIFVTLVGMATEKGLDGNKPVFQRTPDEVAQEVLGQTRLMGRARTTRELRHTVAQRLVDAGATGEELAAYMGHSSLETGLVYYRSSASQAELINRALGASSTYKRLAKIAHNRFISEQELASLKEGQQIGGTPHGIPISGIGGCSSGQPACPFNPVTSCYGCRKFMPVVDLDIHKRVLADFRGVVRSFYCSSREGSNSPAYLQLQRTIDSVQAVIEELESNTSES
jgi:integrase